MNLNRETMKKLMLLILYTVAVLALFFHMDEAKNVFNRVLQLLLPFLLGAAIAFILNVPMRFVEKRLHLKAKNKLKRPLSLAVAILFVAFILGIVTFLLVPQLTDTILSLKDSVPVFFAQVKTTAEKIFIENPDAVNYINSIQVDWKSTVEKMAGFITTGAGSVLSSTVTAAMSIASGLTTFGIAFIFAIYILLQKENLGRQFKKMFYAYFPSAAVDEFIRICAMAEQTFSKFLTGQCTEAVILGTMFFVTLLIFRLPYALLIGVLIAFTALIPIFGAFIGCAVGIFLTLMVSPVQAFWFTVIFFVLQQLEGNLIYPHVVGNSVGLPSIWVLAAVSLGGSMMGIVGMLIFIPFCSVCYALLREDVNRNIEKKKKKADLAIQQHENSGNIGE
ncbi:MAG: AI-2E family transporter [Clostridium sp.]